MNAPARVLLAASLLLAGCAVPLGESYTIVYLRTGDVTPTPDAHGELMTGHFANMKQLSLERHLLVAGPYGGDKHADDLRGVFILDTADRAEARELAQRDPTFAARALRFEYDDLETDAPLRAVLERDLARVAAAEAEGRTVQPGDGIRAYVLLTADEGEHALEVLADHERVVMRARLGGGRALFVLDAATPDEAKDALRSELVRLGSHSLDGWYATGTLAALAERAKDRNNGAP